MKRIILILLCLPLFIFSQEEKKHTKTISISQFAQDLKDAAEQGTNYILENCDITYDPVLDKKYTKTNTGDDYFEADALIRNIHFSDSTSVKIKNCTFGKEHYKGRRNLFPTITFQNCQFGTLDVYNKKEESVMSFDNITAKILNVQLDTVIGVTKYVAIIEGFIGWFMLSIFLVSVLSQMMSV